MTAFTEDVEKALFLRRFDVPFWGITYVFGRNDMYWERIENSFGRYSIVGTTVKDPKDQPKDVIADEKHSKRKGKKVYVATTVGNDVILGAALSPNTSAKTLQRHIRSLLMKRKTSILIICRKRLTLTVGMLRRRHG